MAQTLTPDSLKRTSHAFMRERVRRTSEENQALGFTPGFRDEETGAVYISCWSDGTPGSLSTLSTACPIISILARGPSVAESPPSRPASIAGFVRWGLFYTREQAAHCLD
jgi:hypothetical protein